MPTCAVTGGNRKANRRVGDRCAAVSLFQGVLFLISAGLYLVRRDEYLAFLVVCLALSWINLLYFSRGHKHMGIYSIMIQKVSPAARSAASSTTPLTTFLSRLFQIILSDILRFLFVYVVFLIGFSAGMECSRNFLCSTVAFPAECVTTAALQVLLPAGVISVFLVCVL